MNLGENINVEYNTVDVQFCFGIVLSNLGYNTLAMAMIEFETQQSYNIHNAVITHPVEAARLKCSRDRIDNEIAELAARENLSKEFAAVKWLYTTKILKVSSNNKVHSTTEMQAVSDVLGNNRMDEIYSRIMSILVKYPHNKLLVPYIATTLFDHPFSVTLRRAITSAWEGKVNLSNLNFSPEAVGLLKDDFQKIYENGISESSTPFEPITGSPNAALCGDPIKLWYVYNTKSQLMSVLCGSGQEMALDDGSVSKLNLHEIDDGSESGSIDFIDLCTKIYKCSATLFEHTGFLVYDIFSYHCDREAAEREQKFRKQCGSIYSGINFDVVTSSIGYCINGTHRGKILDRIKYAEYLDVRFSHSVTMKDLKDIREGLYEVTRHVSINDGHRLFETDGHVVYLAQSEAQRFESLMSGYKALYELIDYINANEKRTGVTVDDFPTDIFRDPAYLSRFKTFDEYIKGHKIVKQLLTEIKFSEDYTRREPKVDGFYQNEDVDRILTSKDSIKYIKEFKALGERPISILYGITHRKETLGPADRIAEDAVKIINSPDVLVWGSYYPSIKNMPGVSVETYDTFDYMDCLSMLHYFAGKFADFMNDGVGEEQYMSVSTYSVAIQFLYLLERVQELEGCSITDEDGFFVLDLMAMREGINNKLREITDIVYESDKKKDQLPFGVSIQQIYPQYDSYYNTAKILPHSFVLRILGLCFCSNLFFGVKFNRSNLGSLSSEDVHNVYYTYSILKQYLDTIYTVIFNLYSSAHNSSDDIGRSKAQMRNISNNIFNIAIDTVNYFGYLSIGTHVTSKFDLNCLYSSDMNVYLDAGMRNTDDMEAFNAASRATRKRSDNALQAFNRLLSVFSDTVLLLNDVCKNMKVVLGSAAKDTSSAPIGLLRTMELLDKEIMSDSYIESDNYKRAAALLNVHVTFNEYGFAVKDGSMVCQDAGIFLRYYHRAGVVCLIDSEFASLNHTEFDTIDYDFIESL